MVNNLQQMNKGVFKILVKGDVSMDNHLPKAPLTVETRVGTQKETFAITDKTFQHPFPLLFSIHHHHNLEVYIYPSVNASDMVVYGTLDLSAYTGVPNICQNITIGTNYMNKGILNNEPSGTLELQITYMPEFCSFLEINVKSAILYRDTEMITKMDPYVQLILEGDTHKTTVKQEAGKNPIWNQILLLKVTHMDSRLRVRVMDEDVGVSDVVGEGEVGLREWGVLNGDGVWRESVLNVMYEGVLSGKVCVASRFLASWNNK